MNPHVLIPGGYFFDNPAIWELVYTSEDFRNLLLSCPDNISNTTLLISKHQGTRSHNDRSNLDSVFRTWFAGEDGQRFNNPSSLRIRWWASNNSSEVSHTKLQSLRQEWKSLTIKKYANSLNLTSLEDALVGLDHIFNQSDSIETPSGRHSTFFKGVESILKIEDFEFDGKNELLKLFNEFKKSGKLSRSEIQKSAPKAWQSIKSELICLRQSCYFENYRGAGSISILPNSDIKTSQTTIEKLLEDAQRFLHSERHLVAIDQLTFAEVLEMRKHSGLMQSIKKLSSTQTLAEPQRTDIFLETLRAEWKTNLLDAATQVEKNKKNGKLVFPIKTYEDQIPLILAAASTILPVKIDPHLFEQGHDQLSAILRCCAPLLSGLLPKNPNLSAMLIVRAVEHSSPKTGNLV